MKKLNQENNSLFLTIFITFFCSLLITQASFAAYDPTQGLKSRSKSNKILERSLFEELSAAATIDMETDGEKKEIADAIYITDAISKLSLASPIAVKPTVTNLNKRNSTAISNNLTSETQPSKIQRSNPNSPFRAVSRGSTPQHNTANENAFQSPQKRAPSSSHASPNPPLFSSPYIHKESPLKPIRQRFLCARTVKELLSDAAINTESERFFNAGEDTKKIKDCFDNLGNFWKEDRRAILSNLYQKITNAQSENAPARKASLEKALTEANEAHEKAEKAFANRPGDDEDTCCINLFGGEDEDFSNSMDTAISPQEMSPKEIEEIEKKLKEERSEAKRTCEDASKKLDVHNKHFERAPIISKIMKEFFRESTKLHREKTPYPEFFGYGAKDAITKKLHALYMQDNIQRFPTFFENCHLAEALISLPQEGRRDILEFFAREIKLKLGDNLSHLPPDIPAVVVPGEEPTAEKLAARLAGLLSRVENRCSKSPTLSLLFPVSPTNFHHIHHPCYKDDGTPTGGHNLSYMKQEHQLDLTHANTKTGVTFGNWGQEAGKRKISGFFPEEMSDADIEAAIATAQHYPIMIPDNNEQIFGRAGDLVISTYKNDTNLQPTGFPVLEYIDLEHNKSEEEFNILDNMLTSKELYDFLNSHSATFSQHLQGGIRHVTDVTQLIYPLESRPLGIYVQWFKKYEK